VGNADKLSGHRSENQYARFRSPTRNPSMNAFWDVVCALLGIGVEPKELTFLQITLRGFTVFLSALVMMRFGDRRSLVRRSAFDAVLLIVLASVLARAINGSAAFFGTLGACVMIVLLHRLLAYATCKWPSFEQLVKGSEKVLVRDGAFQERMMTKNCVSREDVEEDMRLDAKTEKITKIKIARLERSGEVSFIKDEEK
jgi:uncharacterized membrane protein YcaP (DUF421 family)